MHDLCESLGEQNAAAEQTLNPSYISYAYDRILTV